MISQLPATAPCKHKILEVVYGNIALWAHHGAFAAEPSSRHVIVKIASREDIIENFYHFLCEIRHRELKQVQVPREMERVRHLFIVLDVEGIALYLDNCALVLIYVAVVGRAENCDD